MSRGWPCCLDCLFIYILFICQGYDTVVRIVYLYIHILSRVWSCCLGCLFIYILSRVLSCGLGCLFIYILSRVWSCCLSCLEDVSDLLINWSGLVEQNLLLLSGKLRSWYSSIHKDTISPPLTLLKTDCCITFHHFFSRKM